MKTTESAAGATPVAPTSVNRRTTAVATEKPRQARAMQTRARLIDAGRSAFAQFGVDGVNLTEDILKPAGVSVGSFYHQFADKTELLLEIIADGIAARQALIIDDGLSADHRSLAQMLKVGAEHFFTSLDTDRYAWRIQIAEQNNADPRIHALILEGRRRWVERIADALRQWSDADADDATLRAAATSIVSLATGTANVYLGLPEKERSAARAELLKGFTQFAIGGTTASLQ